ncbi:MAG TPA: cupin domain-containing protein [bacterium]|nr:cupin domain-containing protein [bacterium]
MKKTLLLVLPLLLHVNAALGQAVEPIAIQELLKTSNSWDGKALPNYPKGKPEITIVRITVQPGAAFPVHQHPMINAGLLLSGELTVTTVENKSIHLKAGDAIAEVVDTWHFGKNEGKVPAEILVFYAGTVGSPLSIKK